MPGKKAHGPAAVVNVHAAKTQFSKLLERVARGETITIARHNVPVACLGPLPAARRWGTARGQFTVPDDFDAPLTEFEAQFYGDVPRRR